jgi:hypothetical protein
LDWKVHPPTPQNFARHFQSFLNIDHPQLRLEILDISDFLMELSVCDYFFVTQKASSVALASILNALDIVCPKLKSVGISSVSIKRSLLYQIKKTLPDLNFRGTPEVAECRIQLKIIYDEAVNSQQLETTVKASEIGSPKGVINESEDGQQAYVKRKRY